MEIEKILGEREKTHGEYEYTAEISQALKCVLRRMSGYSNMPAQVRESLDMIASKMARIVCGDWKEKDHYDDICGYSELAKRSFKDETN